MPDLFLEMIYGVLFRNMKPLHKQRYFSRELILLIIPLSFSLQMRWKEIIRQEISHHPHYLCAAECEPVTCSKELDLIHVRIEITYGREKIKN